MTNTNLNLINLNNNFIMLNGNTTLHKQTYISAGRAENTNDTVITKETIKRLASDIKRIIKEPLDKHGIYYKHDDENILKGYALIIGKPETSYAYGCYLFEFDFPYNYPHSPPIVKFCLSDGSTRFNPNYYINGKVCLSVLNTWKGDQWTGCQNISSILLTLTTVFTDNPDNPLLNEPGVNESHRDCANYKKIITYKNIELAIFNILNNEANISIESSKFNYFHDILINNFINNYDNIMDIIKKENILHNTINKSIIISTSLYCMRALLDYNNLTNNISMLKNKMVNLKDKNKIELNK